MAPASPAAAAAALLPPAAAAAEGSPAAQAAQGSAGSWAERKPDGEALARELRVLWWWNLVCFLLHLVQGIAVLAAALAVAQIKNFKLPITTQFLVWSGTPVVPRQNDVVLGLLPFAAVTSAFAFLSAAAHLLVLLCFKHYAADLARGRNRFRWWEYALSSSLMIVLIAMLFGVYDLFVLIGVGAINCAMCLFGDLHEVMNAGKKPTDVDWTAYIYGTMAGLVPWGIIIAYIAATPNLNLVPKFVWAILVIYFLLFQTFPTVMYMQYAQRCWCSNARYPKIANGGYYAGERSYQVCVMGGSAARARARAPERRPSRGVPHRRLPVPARARPSRSSPRACCSGWSSAAQTSPTRTALKASALL